MLYSHSPPHQITYGRILQKSVVACCNVDTGIWNSEAYGEFSYYILRSLDWLCINCHIPMEIKFPTHLYFDWLTWMNINSNITFRTHGIQSVIMDSMSKSMSYFFCHCPLSASDSAPVLTTIVKNQFLKGRLDTNLCLHPILRFFFHFLISKILSLSLFFFFFFFFLFKNIFWIEKYNI